MPVVFISLDDTATFFYLVAYQGMQSNGLERLRFDEGFSGIAARTKSFIAQRVSELEDKNRATFLLRKGIRTIICVPLISADRVGGVMNLATANEYAIDKGKIDLLVTIGNQIAMAVHNSRLYEDLKKKIADLEEKNEIIKFFAYSISHDLKSPATGIYGLAKHLNDSFGGALEEKGKKHCHQIMKAAEQIVEMVEKVNAFIIAKEAPLDLQKIDMKEITEILQTEFSERLRQQNIVWTKAKNVPAITADKLGILRILRNLLDNALKYGGDGMREVKMGFSENDDFYIFSFRDDGVGIKKEEGEMIFGRFKRMKTSQGITGAGMGLAIVKEIVERHGGKVWMENGTEKGTLFYFSVSKALSGHEIVSD